MPTIRKRALLLLILLILLLWLLGQLLMFWKAPTVIIENNQQFHNLCHASALPPDVNPTTTIFIITPTYTRPVQKAELTRLMHTFTSRLLDTSLVIHWILVEDAPRKSDLVAHLLQKSGLVFTHLNVETPAEMRVDVKKGEKKWSKPRGVLQRNAGLEWVRGSVPADTRAVVYFADDDNTYDVELFREMAAIERVGVWPVAFVGELMVEKPVIDNGKVVAWDVGWNAQRPFAIDMAGFAVNLRLIHDHPDARFDFNQPVGYQESFFLKSLGVAMEHLEPKAGNGSPVLVWHTRAEAINLTQERKRRAQGRPSDAGIEV
ncbi:galactosylgalactosylxylosylprotein 3-beta-glucuronosyltransferase 3-like [Paramacrobiotus metropolitanus]|uniref:galactosylgalactosylxylosylprotein 3-beta-glucuronosyltransferase 3-like n=1 Tax=Paramacrobiotus metropolitanus TaxID=2943436 RepID=UPI0024461971|nr:galactosylgalactosylxylosylprotein 3-beta-glucuronosyltransferase 3-like [Paramacrobiotus metropolitanus]